MLLLRRNERFAKIFDANTRNVGRFVTIYVVGVVMLVILIGSWFANRVYVESGLGAKVYEVADLWDLFLGVVFIIVVMVFPNGIVGTWNRWRIERRIRQMERELQAQKESAVSS